MYPFLLSANWYGFVPTVCKHYQKSELHWPKGPLFRESGAHIHHLEHFFRTLIFKAGYKHKRSPWWLRNKGWDSVLHVSFHFLYTYSICKFSTCKVSSSSRKGGILWITSTTPFISTWGPELRPFSLSAFTHILRWFAVAFSPISTLWVGFIEISLCEEQFQHNVATH